MQERERLGLVPGAQAGLLVRGAILAGVNATAPVEDVFLGTEPDPYL